MYQQGPINNPSYGQYPGFPPSKRPLPLGQAIKQLFSQYVRIYTAPGRATFAAEVQKAEWGIIWVQLFSLDVLLFFSMIIAYLITASLLAISTFFPAVFQHKILTILFGGFGLLSLIASLGFLLLVPSLFFLMAFFQHLIARSFGGKGTLVQHIYGCTLIYVPLLLLMSFGALVPLVNLFLPLLLPFLMFYAIVLNILMLMAAHGLSGGKAIVVVFSPLIVLFLFLFVFFMLMITSLL